MSSEGIFSKWQPHYAEKRIATFPVGHDKRPQIKRWNELGLNGSAKLAKRFTEANALGFQVGSRSQITVLDVDTRNEGVLADALREHGEIHSLSAPEAVITLTTATPVNTVAYVLMQTNRLTCWVVAMWWHPRLFQPKGVMKSSSAVWRIWEAFHPSMPCSIIYGPKRGSSKARGTTPCSGLRLSRPDIATPSTPCSIS